MLSCITKNLACFWYIYYVFYNVMQQKLLFMICVIYLPCGNSNLFTPWQYSPVGLSRRRQVSDKKRYFYSRIQISRFISLSVQVAPFGPNLTGRLHRHIIPNSLYFVYSLTDNKITSHHFIYDHGDLKQNFHCGYTGGVTNNTNYDPLLLSKYVAQNERHKSRISRVSERDSCRFSYTVFKEYWLLLNL